MIVLTNSSMLDPAVRPEGRWPRPISSSPRSTPRPRRRLQEGQPSPSRRFPAAEIVAGLAAFRKEYRGQIWLEVLLVKGLNDRPADLRALKKAIARIRPDRVQLNTVVRPPAESSARPLSSGELEKIRAFLGGPAEIIADFKKVRPDAAATDLPGRILEFIRRRPETAEGIARSLGAEPSRPSGGPAGRWRKTGTIRPVTHRGRVFFEPIAGTNGKLACLNPFSASGALLFTAFVIILSFRMRLRRPN